MISLYNKQFEVDKPMVTVVIPAYNAEPTIEECLDSVTSQWYQNLEIIIIDDHSTDGTARIAQEYAEKDGRVHVMQKDNAGPGAARNDGLRMAHGKYLQFVDADDVLDVAAIATTVRIAERTQADLVSFDFILFDDEGQTLSRSGAVPLAYPDIGYSSGIECLRQIYLGHLGYFSWAFLYRLDTIHACEMRYPENIHLLEDMLMLNRLLRHDLRVAYCGKQLYGYRKNANSLSHSGDAERALQGLQVITTVEDMCEAENLQMYARSAVSILLYLDSLMPVGSPNQRLLRAETKRMAAICGVGKLERHVLLRLLLTSTGIIDVIRKLKTGTMNTKY